MEPRAPPSPQPRSGKLQEEMPEPSLKEPVGQAEKRPFPMKEPSNNIEVPL